MISRTKLSHSQRRALSNIVTALFDGVTLCVSRQGECANAKYLCFRMAAEALPRVPGLKESLEAAETGLYMTGDITRNGALTGRTWLGTGPLDEILVTLDQFGDAGPTLEQINDSLRGQADMLERVNIESFGDMSVVMVSLEGPLQQTIAMSDQEFEAYMFGDGCTVAEHDGWVVETHGATAAEATKIVYLRFDDDQEDVDSHKASFKVRFEHGVVQDVVALLHSSGNEIGMRRALNAIEPNSLVEPILVAPFVDGKPVDDGETLIHPEHGEVIVVEDSVHGWCYQRLGYSGFDVDFQNLSRGPAPRSEERPRG